MTLFSDEYFPVRFRAQQRTKYIPLQLTANCIVALMTSTPYQSDLRISNYRGHKFPPSLTLLSFKTSMNCSIDRNCKFSELLFQLLQYPRQRQSYPANRAALMTKTVSIFPAFSSRFVDFAVQFCFRWASTKTREAGNAGTPEH